MATKKTPPPPADAIVGTFGGTPLVPAAADMVEVEAAAITAFADDYVFMSISELRAIVHVANPKKHDVPGIAGSILRFGFTIPLVIDSRSNVLAAGHGRLAGVARLFSEGPARRQKDEPAPVWPPIGLRVRADGQWLIPVKRHAFVNDSERDAYLIADNRLTEAGGWDPKSLRAMMLKLSAVEMPTIDRLATMGYAAKDYNRLMSGLRVSTKGAKERDEGGAGGLTYKVIVTCVDEDDQAKLIERMEGEGYVVASLIS